MQKKLTELAELIGGEIEGARDVVIKGIAGIKEAKKGEISFIENNRYLSLLGSTSASAVIISHRHKSRIEPSKRSVSLIYAEDSSLAFSKVASLFIPELPKPHGIHPTAVIGKGVNLGKDVAVQACAVIKDNVQIGARTIIHSGVHVGQETSIGEDCLIYPNVSIHERTRIGSRVIIHSGAVIGSDGFGFSTTRGLHRKVSQLGIVEINDDVEIGANTTIDRARFDKTSIGRGTKIDNLVQIGHNVVIGENAIIVAQTAIAGSVQIGKNVTIAGQVGIAGHISIANNVVAVARSGITKSIPENTSVSGFPAKPHNQEQKIKACVQRLPVLFQKFRELEKKMEK